MKKRHRINQKSNENDKRDTENLSVTQESSSKIISNWLIESANIVLELGLQLLTLLIMLILCLAADFQLKFDDCIGVLLVMDIIECTSNLSNVVGKLGGIINKMSGIIICISSVLYCIILLHSQGIQLYIRETNILTLTITLTFLVILIDMGKTGV